MTLADRLRALTDRLVPYYLWFVLGFGVVSVGIGIGNSAMVLVTMLTVKQIYVPLWAIVVFGLLLISFCMLIGWSFEHYKIWDRINSHANQNMNPEIRSICSDMKEIRAALNIQVSVEPWMLGEIDWL